MEVIKIDGDHEGCRLDLKSSPATLMRVDHSAGKGTSGMGECGSVIDRMNMKLGSNFLNSLRIKIQLLKKLQRAIVVDSATHFQKDGVEGNGGSLEDGAQAKLEHIINIHHI